ncbi:MAG: type CRISPR-associated protein Csx17 [Chthoniobacteraceae bacterium]|nr:type CRISPR-associated protein Csx17 [Chthoniobacteraceae bacterium]
MKLPLPACTPTPLASYLKALGVLRLLSEQHPQANIRGAWERGCFVIHGDMAREKLIAFFLNDYAPTPIMVPWSGQDFFKVNREQTQSAFRSLLKSPKGAKRPSSNTIIESILVTDTPRLSEYRKALKSCFDAMDKVGLTKKEQIEGTGKAERANKRSLLIELRNRVPDEIVRWIDAATVIESDAFGFNALLGSGGGSDGNSHFSDNFMQALWMALPVLSIHFEAKVTSASSDPFHSEQALEAALFGTLTNVATISNFSPVLFDSSRVGGPNSTTGFSADSASNPWDFILMMEGALLFAGALARKHGSQNPGRATFPFVVTATPVGGVNLINNEASGNEIWMPLWTNPVSVEEVSCLIAEGRLEAGTRIATKGLDVARALSSLGVDRGITAFQRFGILRGRVGGDNYNTAVNLGIFSVRQNTDSDLLSDFDEWLERATTLRTSDKTPESFKAALNGLDRAIMAFCKNSGDPHRAQEMLIALGRCERTMAGSQKWAHEAFLKPVPLLQTRWLSAANTGTAEYRLAAALAGLTGPLSKTWLPLRSHLEPVTAGRKEDRRWFSWQENPSRDVVWHDGPLADALNAILARRVVLAARGERLADTSFIPARLPDIAAFIDKRTDDRLLASLLWGLCLVDFGADYNADFKLERPREDHEPTALYALLKLCFSRHSIRETEIPLVAAIQRRAAAGDGVNASTLAARRLRASGLPVAVGQMHLQGETVQRTAAALLFPLSATDTSALAERVLRPAKTQPNPATQLA